MQRRQGATFGDEALAAPDKVVGDIPCVKEKQMRQRAFTVIGRCPARSALSMMPILVL